MSVGLAEASSRSLSSRSLPVVKARLGAVARDGAAGCSFDILL